MLAFDQASTLMKEWMERQQKAFEAMSPKFERMDSVSKAAELWRSYMEFWTTLSKAMPLQANALEAAMDSLVKPAAGIPAGGGIAAMIGRMTEGPELATLWDWDQKWLRISGTWLELKQASIAYHALIGKAWNEAYGRFLAELAKPAGDGAEPIKTWRQGLELWFSIANQCLLEAQRSPEVLDAQRRHLRAAMDYRSRLRELSEEFCELFQIPGRGEVDELARLIHELRREVRQLRRQAGQTPAAQASVPNIKS